MTFFDDLKCSFVDVTVSQDQEINAKEFLLASEGLRDMFNLFNSAAFTPVQNDMTGNITKIRARSEELGASGATLQQIVLSEAAQKKKDATQGLLWLTRGLRFTLVAMERNVKNPDEELATSFTKSYNETLSKHHSMFIRPVFKLAMNACPYRKDFYAKLGSPLEKVMEQIKAWLAALNKIVEIIEQFLASGNYAKGL